MKTATLNLNVVRGIYRREGIKIDLWEASRKIRAVYMCDGGDPSVLINRKLPRDPRLFALVHELKHHYCDRDQISSAGLKCGDYNLNREIEVGAEIFAAEFIFPEAEFLSLVADLGLDARPIEATDVVVLKRSVSAPISYTFLRKRLEHLRLVPRGIFAKVQFTKLEQDVYGLPIYKQPWFVKRRLEKRRLRRS